MHFITGFSCLDYGTQISPKKSLLYWYRKSNSDNMLNGPRHIDFHCKMCQMSLCKTCVPAARAAWRTAIACLAHKIAQTETGHRLIHLVKPPKWKTRPAALHCDTLWQCNLNYRLYCPLLLKHQRTFIRITIITAEFISLCWSQRLHTILRHPVQIKTTRCFMLKLRDFLHSSTQEGIHLAQQAIFSVPILKEVTLRHWNHRTELSKLY